MTLEEEIIHAEDVARMNHEAAKHLIDEHPTQAEKCEACAKEHEQLAEWLKELKAYKEQSGDAISRRAVLDIIRFEDKWLLDAKEHNVDTKMAFWAIKSKISEMPSVTPQQKTEQQRTGRWIKDEHGGQYKWVCSNCGTYHRALYDYCPSCGAKMEVEE